MQDTLADLEYNVMDVAEELKRLTISDYYETLLDNNDITLTPFFVFGRTIQNKQVYIKIKIKEFNGKYVFCLSFHFSEHRMEKFPYRK